jgi:tetratricopeptide (TPR) repeat protein
VVDLRVEDSPSPLRDLRRLLMISRAYQFMNQGDELLAEQDNVGALDAYAKAMELAPQITEIQFWVALTLFTNGQETEALENFRQVFARDRNWVEVLRRLPAADLLENEDGEVDRILSVLE